MPVAVGVSGVRIEVSSVTGRSLGPTATPSEAFGSAYVGTRLHSYCSRVVRSTDAGALVARRAIRREGRCQGRWRPMGSRRSPVVRAPGGPATEARALGVPDTRA